MPIVFFVCFLNVLRMQLSAYIASFVLLSFFLLIIGLLLSLLFVACKGLTIYMSSNQMEEESDDEETQESPGEAHEGGSREILE